MRKLIWSKSSIQLAHAGRKIEVLMIFCSSSSIAFSQKSPYKVPKLSLEEITKIKELFCKMLQLELKKQIMIQ